MSIPLAPCDGGFGIVGVVRTMVLHCLEAVQPSIRTTKLHVRACPDIRCGLVDSLFDVGSRVFQGISTPLGSTPLGSTPLGSSVRPLGSTPLGSSVRLHTAPLEELSPLFSGCWSWEVSPVSNILASSGCRCLGKV